MEERAPGAMGMMASSIAAAKKNPGKAQLERVFDAPPRPKPAQKPAAVVSEGSSSGTQDLVYEIDPELIDEWEFVDRPESEFGDLEELTASVRSFGQEVPILLRPKQGGRYELIYGRRRWTVCKDLGIKVKAFVRQIDDRTAYQKMSLENRSRQDLSSWARAMSYKKAIDMMLYESQSALAAHLGIDRGTLSNMMIYTKLPDSLTQAIGSMKNVGIHTAKTIVAMLDEPANEPALLQLADQIGAGKLAGKSLISAVHRLRETDAETGSGIARDEAGNKLFSWRLTDRGAVQLTFAKESLKDRAVDDLVKQIRDSFK